MTVDTITMPTMGKSVWVQMRMDEEFKARLQQAANRRGTDMTSLIMHAITTQYPETMATPSTLADALAKIPDKPKS